MECEWIFDPDDWQEKFETKAIPNEPIECGRDVPSGAKYCQYHENLRGNDEVDITPEEAFKSLLEEEGNVFGAHFQVVDLDEVEVSGDKINLKNVVISSRFRIDSLNADTNIRFSNSVFDRVRFQDVEVNERLELKGCHIRKQAAFRDITASSKLEFNGTTFDRDARFAGQFKDPVEFLRCDFRSGILFRDSFFRNGLKLKETSVDEDIYVHNCDIRRKLEFNGSVPKRRVFISETDVSDIGLRFDTSRSTLVLFHGSTIHDGVLHQPEEEETYYDLTNTTLGDVQIRPEYDLCNYHFNETKYDGFRFYHHRNQFQKEGWQIHKFRPTLGKEYFVDHTNLTSSITPPPVPRYEANMELKDKSETYLLARKAAARQGDNISASKLHIVEMKSRKERYKHSVLFSNGNSYPRRGKDAIRYVKNQFHRVTSVYGESPFRIVWLSAVSIILWAGVIAYLGGVTDGSSIASVETMLESEEVTIWEVMRKNIHMSVASFTTLGSNSYRPATSAVEFATMFAAFVGPFMIALFVFTLGRQIRR